MQKCSVFADAFNYFIYGGKQVINPENLRELDTTEIAIPFGNGNEVAVQKFRDVLKEAVLMMDDNAAYLVFGVENEADVKYAEPVKTGLYDFLQYAKQINQISDKHTEKKEWKGHNAGEYLSGFCKGDRLTPVITLVILFNSKEWDGPKSLHEMMSTQNPDILKYVADYKLNLIEPAVLGVEDLEKFHSNLRAVLGFIKYSNDGEKLEEFLSKEKSLEALEADAARVIKTCTNTDIPIDEKAEVVDVCKAVREMNEKAAKIATEKAEKAAKVEAEKAVEKSRLETLRDSVKNIMVSLQIGVEEAMKILKICNDDQAILRKMM